MDAPAGKGGRTYREKYSAYATRFDAGLRTVKRWVALGVEKSDPCPLDDPVALRAWWTKHMSHRVPEAIVREAASLTPLLDLPIRRPKPAPVAQEPSPANLLPPAPRVLVEMSTDDVGIHVLLIQAQQRAHQAHAQWLAAATEAEAAFAERRCIATAEAVRKIQKDADEAAIRMRDYIPRLPAEQQITEFGTDLLNRVRGQVEEMARALGVPVTPEMERRWNESVDELCATLQQEIFIEDTPE